KCSVGEAFGMGNNTTDTAAWRMFEPQAQKRVLNTLRLLTSSVSTLAVLLLLQEEQPDGATAPPEKKIEAVEKALRADLRQNDAVLHGGLGCCAVLLIGADEDGACAVIRRLHGSLSQCAGALPLSLGWAATGKAEQKAEALIALALAGRRPFLPVADEKLFV